MITIVAQMDAYEQSSNKYQVGTDNNKKKIKKLKKRKKEKKKKTTIDI